MSAEPASTSPPARLFSLDAFRGAVMLLMVTGGFGFPEIAKHFPGNFWWQSIGYQTDHAAWEGCTVWDLIQPAFMFMVGIALPWSVASRQARGASFGRLLAHALWRSVLLVLLAVFLSSDGARETNWTFVNVLAQIGLGYPLLFLLAFSRERLAWVTAALLLTGHWLAFALYPAPGPTFDWTAVGVPPDWPHHFSGLARHWEKNANAGFAFDQWFLNLWPRSKPFVFNAGGYATLNFVPSLVTMIFGLNAGRLLRSDLSLQEKLARLIVAGVAGIAVGWLCHALGLCPLVKRIWTPSWALFSAGWVSLLLAAAVGLIERQREKPPIWCWPFVVVGLNPIAIYILFQLSGGYIRQQLRTHLGQGIFESFGPVWLPAVQRGSVLVVLWLIVWWMYRRRIFVRL